MVKNGAVMCVFCLWSISSCVSCSCGNLAIFLLRIFYGTSTFNWRTLTTGIWTCHKHTKSNNHLCHSFSLSIHAHIPHTVLLQNVSVLFCNQLILYSLPPFGCPTTTYRTLPTNGDTISIWKNSFLVITEKRDTYQNMALHAMLSEIFSYIFHIFIPY